MQYSWRIGAALLVATALAGAAHTAAYAEQAQESGNAEPSVSTLADRADEGDDQAALRAAEIYRSGDRQNLNKARKYC